MLNNNIPQSENVDPKLAILNEFLEDNPPIDTIKALLMVLDCIAVASFHEPERVGGAEIWIVKDLIGFFLQLNNVQTNSSNNHIA